MPTTTLEWTGTFRLLLNKLNPLGEVEINGRHFPVRAANIFYRNGEPVRVGIAIRDQTGLLCFLNGHFDQFSWSCDVSGKIDKPSSEIVERLNL
jgi:hypothetical protein